MSGFASSIDWPRVVARSARRAGVLWRARVLGQRFIERRVHDYRMVLDAEDPGLSYQLLRDAAREPEQKYLLDHTLKPGMRVFDLGANLGYYSIMMARLVGDAGRVYAVEPVERNFALLERNVHMNGLRNVQIERVAIADSDGEKQMLMTAQSNWCSFHRPDADPSAEWTKKYQRSIVAEVAVPTRTLSGYLSDKPWLDLIRMDLEGYELEIFRALAELPVARSVSVLFETHPEFYGGGEAMRSALHALRRSSGLVVKYLVSDYQSGSRRRPEIEPARRVFERLGFGPAHILAEFESRAIYQNVDQEAAVDLISRSENVNAALLAPQFS